MVSSWGLNSVDESSVEKLLEDDETRVSVSSLSVSVEKLLEDRVSADDVLMRLCLSVVVFFFLRRRFF